MVHIHLRTFLVHSRRFSFQSCNLNCVNFQILENCRTTKNISRMISKYWLRLKVCVVFFFPHKDTVFSSTGRRPASLCHGPLSVVRPSVRALTFSLNIFFAETTYRILMKFHRNVPTMVLFRISWNNLIPSKTLVAMATKLKIFWNLWKSSCQKP